MPLFVHRAAPKPYNRTRCKGASTGIPVWKIRRILWDRLLLYKIICQGNFHSTLRENKQAACQCVPMPIPGCVKDAHFQSMQFQARQPLGSFSGTNLALLQNPIASLRLFSEAVQENHLKFSQQNSALGISYWPVLHLLLFSKDRRKVGCNKGRWVWELGRLPENNINKTRSHQHKMRN